MSDTFGRVITIIDGLLSILKEIKKLRGTN